MGVYLSTIEANQWAFVFYFLSLVFFSANMFKLKFLHTLNIAWYRFGILLGLIVSPIVWGAIFFLLITPIALIIRLGGRDELRLKRLHQSSYWINVDVIKPNEKSFRKQF